MAWIILPTVGELTSTGYGWALLLKVALVVVVIALGAFNRYRLVPAVQVRNGSPTCNTGRNPATTSPARRWLGRVVVTELAVLLVAVGVTAVMVTRSPLPTAAAADADAAQTVTVALSDDGGSALVTVTPSGVGFNVVDIELRDVAGRVVNPYEPPAVELSLPELDVGPLRPEVLALGIGRYQATVDLGFAGTWELSLRVRVDEFESVSGSAPIIVE